MLATTRTVSPLTPARYGPVSGPQNIGAEPPRTIIERCAPNGASGARNRRSGEIGAARTNELIWHELTTSQPCNRQI